LAIQSFPSDLNSLPMHEYTNIASTMNRRGIPPSVLQQPQQPAAILLSSEATAKFELGLTLVLNAWQALTLAVQNQWGGPDSKDKRDWMCGAVAELFAGTLYSPYFF